MKKHLERVWEDIVHLLEKEFPFPIQKGKCNSPIFSTFERAYVVCVLNIGLLHFPF